MSPLAIIGCLLVAATAMWISARLFGHPFSPFSVFYGAWFVAFALYNLHWIDYTPVRRPAWTLIGLSLVGFGLGWLIPYLLWNSRDVQDSELVARQVSPERLRVVIVICCVLGAIGLAAFLAKVSSTLGLATFIESPFDIRELTGRGGALEEPLKIFDWLNVANVVLCSFYLFVVKGRRSWLVWPVLAFSVIALFLMEDRTHFFYACCWAGFVLLHSMRVTVKRILVLMAVGATLLLSQFLLVALWLGKVAEKSPVLMQAANVRDAMVFLLPPYFYITVNFPALQAYMDSSPPPTHGYMTMYPAFRFFHAVDPTLAQPPMTPEFLQVPADANTFTWVHQFYSDFGTTGVLIGSWIIGVVTAFVYFHMLGTRSFYSTLINGIFSYCLALSVFANHFVQGPAWYFLVVSFLIALWIKVPAASLRSVEARS